MNPDPNEQLNKPQSQVKEFPVFMFQQPDTMMYNQFMQNQVNMNTVQQNQLQQNVFQNQMQQIIKPKIVSDNNLLETLRERADNVQLKNEPKQSKSSNAKNTYIKKISTLIKKSNEGNSYDQVNDKEKYKERKIKNTSSILELDQEIDKDQIKLARNRESARNSRKRKKIYLELLESKVTQLQEFLQESKINYKNESQSTRQIVSKNLQNSLESNTSESNIHSIIETLKNKFGTINQEKVVILDYYFKQISEQILPIHMQYILFAISEGKDIFAELQEDTKIKINNDNGNEEGVNEFPNFIKSLNLTEGQKQKAFKIAKKLMREKKKIQSQVQSMFELKEEMKTELQGLNETLESLRQQYKPSQIGRFIMQIENSQYSEQMKQSFQKFFAEDNLYDNINFTQSDEDDCDTDFYEFIKNEDANNTLLVDINDAYDIYADAYDFVTKKRILQKEAKE